jgi:hypothetical protein
MLKKITAIVAAVIVILFFWSANQSNISLEQDRQLAQTYCSSCHLFPEPDILPKDSWLAALGYMGYYLGVTNLDYLEGSPDFVIENVQSKLRYLEREGVFPAPPLISEEDWETVRSYYLNAAPDFSREQLSKLQSAELSQFNPLRTSYRFSPPMLTTAVGIDSTNNQVYLGDSFYESITSIGNNGRVVSGPRNFFPPVTPIKFEFTQDAIFVGSIGDVFGSSTAEDAPGFIGILTEIENGIGDAIYSPLIGNLPRIADFLRVDLDLDGNDDFVVSGFGLATGQLSIHWGRDEGGFEVQALANRAGAVKAQTSDFNDDGIPDIAVLFADAREGIVIYENNGNRIFNPHNVLEMHSAYGHTYFEIKDMDGDGMEDFLVANGDNVDSDPYNTLKNYHGVRIYKNYGDYNFVEDYFYPMYGAYRAQAEDFDLDGDLDIAAIAFFPDFSLDEPESFIYLENNDGVFTPFSSAQANQGRWMTMDVGDIDGDGLLDIALGASYVPLGMSNYMEKFQEMAANGPGAMILQNNSRD